jgi:tetratricopeptide (TPR) repeat protein
VILTGKPPYVGPSADAVRLMSIRGDLDDAFARLEGCGAEPELLELCRSCLARRPEDRPADAGAVAQSIARFRASAEERARRAEVERAEAEVRVTEQKKRRRVQAALGLTFTSLVVLVGAFAWWSREQLRDRRAQAERSVSRAMEDAVARYGRARGADSDLTLWGEARAAALQAREQAIAADAPLEVRNRASALLSEIEQIGQNRRLVADLLHIHASMGDRVTFNGDQDFEAGDRRYTQAFRDYGTDLFQLTPEQGADLLRKLGGEIKMELAAALDDWAYVRRTANYLRGRGTVRWIDVGKDEQGALFRLTKRLDPDPMRNRIRDAAMVGDYAALAALAEEIDPAVHPAQTVNLLGVYLYWNKGQRGLKDMVRLLRKAQPYHPGDFQINHNLAYFLSASRLHDEALPYCVAALAVRPRSAVAWFDQARVFEALHREADSIVSYRRLVEMSPNAWYFLGNVASMLEKQGKTDEADAEYRKAAALAPKFPAPHLVFVSRWAKLGLIDEMLPGLRKSLTLDPTDPPTRLLLLQLLARQHKSSEFLTELERLTSGDVEVVFRLGDFLRISGQLVEAAATYRSAIRLKPDYAEAHGNLGFALDATGHRDEAIEAWRRSVSLNPAQPNIWYWVGRALLIAGRPEDAAEPFRQVLARFPAGSQRAKEARLVLSGTNPYARLRSILEGKDRPKDAEEAIFFAALSHSDLRYTAAARIWAEALEADPKLGDDRQTQHRYSAARSAAMAAAGRGKDDPPPDDTAKARLRARALDWLGAERDAWTKLLDGDAANSRAMVSRALEHWKVDTELAGVRDPDALARVPEAERQEWYSLWADVEVLLERVQ